MNTALEEASSPASPLPSHPDVRVVISNQLQSLCISIDKTLQGFGKDVDFRCNLDIPRNTFLILVKAVQTTIVIAVNIRRPRRSRGSAPKKLRSPLRKRLHWMQMHLDPSSPDAVWSLPWRCHNLLFSSFFRALESSFFRASESDVRHFSWAVWCCVFCLVFVRFWGVIRWWFTVAEAAALDAFACCWSLFPRVVRRCGSGYIGCRCIWTHLLQMQSGRCLGGVIIFFF